MPAIINHKICDNASACGGINVCPVGAFTYNENTKRIEIDNTKCISCGACEKTCPIGAIGVAKTNEEYEALKRAIEQDPRSPSDLFVDRFGGDIVSEEVMVDFAEIDTIIKNEGNALIELFNDDSIMCLLKSITYSDILNNTKYTRYFRCNAQDNNLAKFGITELPALIACNNGKITKVINGYYEETEKQKLFELLK